jgi:hypothetical protein
MKLKDLDMKWLTYQDIWKGLKVSFNINKAWNGQLHKKKAFGFGKACNEF